MQGIVFNIQRFTTHDGPGIRTELFLKGCPLRCHWCGNPESFNRQVEVGVYTNRCLSSDVCGDCETNCPQPDMLLRTETNILTKIDRDKCTNCMECSDNCPSDAIKRWGKAMSVEECMVEIVKDQGFYVRSGGGVTISGGEPLMQSDFVTELLEKCQEKQIHTCVESCFHINWKLVEKVLPYTNMIISDIKVMDSEKHKKYTGVHNHKILENLRKLSKTDIATILRIPVIPTVNDDMDNMKATADFILNEMSGNVKVLQLLSFMRLGEEKYASLGMSYKMDYLEFDRVEFQEKVNQFASYFKKRGINCTVGTKD